MRNDDFIFKITATFHKKKKKMVQTLIVCFILCLIKSIVWRRTLKSKYVRKTFPYFPLFEPH